MHFLPTPANDPIQIAPYLERERTKDATRKEQAEREARRGRGVCWSGLTGPATFEPRSEAEIMAAANRAMTISERFAHSSRGRFMTAIANIQRAGVYAYDAEIARKAYARGFAELTRSTTFNLWIPTSIRRVTKTIAHAGESAPA